MVPIIIFRARVETFILGMKQEEIVITGQTVCGLRSQTLLTAYVAFLAQASRVTSIISERDEVVKALQMPRVLKKEKKIQTKPEFSFGSVAKVSFLISLSLQKYSPHRCSNGFHLMYVCAMWLWDFTL